MDDLDLIFQALANPARRQILRQLTRGEATVMELARPSGLTQPTISSHLKVLEAAGLVTRSRSAQQRPVQLAPAAFQSADIWLGDFRAFWETSLEQLEAHAKALEQQEKDNG